MPEPTPPTRRRWFRFSLRSLLVFTALVGLLMGWIVKERRQSALEEEIAQQLEKKGWKATFVEHRQRGWWSRLSTKVLGRRIERLAVKGRVTDFSALEAFTDLQVYIHNQEPFGKTIPPEYADVKRSFETTFPPRELTLLSQLTHLRLLEVESTNISKDHIEQLILELPNCRILLSENGTWSSSP